MFFIFDVFVFLMEVNPFSKSYPSGILWTMFTKLTHDSESAYLQRQEESFVLLLWLYFFYFLLLLLLFL